MKKIQFDTIYKQDCLAFMRKLEASIFDVIVTSPPYNINKDYSVYKESTVRKTITITISQANFTEKYTINLSRFVQKKLEERMTEGRGDI